MDNEIMKNRTNKQKQWYNKRTEKRKRVKLSNKSV